MGFIDKLRAIMPRALGALSKRYDLDSVEGVQAIPTQHFMYNPHDGKTYAYYDIEYVLQRKATEHKKAGKLDVAIACLYKANDIMPISDMSYSQKDYLRLANYLRLAKRFDEAKAVEKKYGGSSAPVSTRALSSTAYDISMNNARQLGTDLIEIAPLRVCCTECAKYQGRVYSISGSDKRFPKLPEFIIRTKGAHCSGLLLYAFDYGVSIMRDLNGNIVDAITYSNRPFTDERTQEQVSTFETRKSQVESEELDRQDYNTICELLPDVAPKSFGGYRKMKNANSANYIKLVQAAETLGYSVHN